MEVSMRRINALVKKEMKDFPKNMNVSLVCLMPIGLVLIFANIVGVNLEQGMGKIELLNIGLSMNLIMVSTYAISMLIAEEKEKNTMRTLMLSSVSPIEFLVGKAVVIFLFSVVTNIAIYFIVGIDIQYLVQYLLWTTILTVIMIQIGGIIGLIAQNQMATGVLGMPVIMGFLIIPMLAPANDIFQKTANLLPNYNLQVLLYKFFNGEGYSNSTNNILVILVWIALVTIGFIYTYSKKGLDK